MGRRKRNLRLSDSMLERIQDYLDVDATIAELSKRYNDPELSDYFESLHNSAYSIIEEIGRALSLKGKPDMKQVEQDYDYYNKLGLVKSEYRRSEDAKI